MNKMLKILDRHTIHSAVMSEEMHSLAIEIDDVDVNNLELVMISFESIKPILFSILGDRANELAHTEHVELYERLFLVYMSIGRLETYYEFVEDLKDTRGALSKFNIKPHDLLDVSLLELYNTLDALFCTSDNNHMMLMYAGITGLMLAHVLIS